ncbi:MAG: VOC family protein [Thermoleophilia bacterium]|nr:VOC family protein [Thermoleophilia bacterium]
MALDVGAGIELRLTGAGRPDTRRGLAALVLETGDLASLLESVALAGGTRIDEPGRDGGRLAASVLDPDGLAVRFESCGPASRPGGSTPPVRFHHVNAMTGDLRRREAFYRRGLGFRSVLEFTRNDSGFLLMADLAWDADGHGALVEMVGGPDAAEWDERDRRVWRDAGGPSYDHLCFAVDDIERRYAIAVDAGMAPLSAPRFYEEHGTSIAWLLDPDGVQVELIAPAVPGAETIAEALRSGVAADRYVEGWSRLGDHLPGAPARSD